jgi:hypothetical protein
MSNSFHNNIDKLLQETVIVVSKAMVITVALLSIITILITVIQ